MTFFRANGYRQIKSLAEDWERNQPRPVISLGRYAMHPVVY